MDVKKTIMGTADRCHRSVIKHGALLQGWSPLHHAASCNHVAAAEALLSGGAAASLRDSSVSLSTPIAAHLCW